jgi:hypothetical protein
MIMLDEIKKYARQTPFRPFALQTDSGTQFDIVDSYRIAIDEDRGRVVVFDIDGLVEIIDLNAVQTIFIP